MHYRCRLSMWPGITIDPFSILQDSIGGREFLDQLNNCQLLEDSSHNGISKNAFEFKLSRHVTPENAPQIIQAIVTPESGDSFPVLRAGRTGRQRWDHVHKKSKSYSYFWTVWVVNTPVSYSGILWFDSRTESLLSFSYFSLVPPLKIWNSRSIL